MNAGAVKTAIFENPYIPLCTPPTLIVIQFLLGVTLFANGMPDYIKMSGMTSIPLAGAFFGVCAFSAAAILLGLRGVIYGSNKVAPALGIAFNLVYLVVFVGFFIMLIPLKATN
jgi:TRAP-type C4-dicarboxylate transport system permease small subunit